MKQRRIICTGGSGFIGAHLIDCLLSYPSVDVLNLDVVQPETVSHKKHWKCIDILDGKSLTREFLDFQPTHLVHLAARTTMKEKTVEDYAANVAGTVNVLDSAKSIHSLQRVLVASTQHVRKPGSGPAWNDEDYEPFGAYGQSKVLTEWFTRNANLQCCWTIIRPTTIWGPGHWGLAKGLWRVIGKGLYLHPRGDTVIRSYGYVKNLVYQIVAIMDASPGIVHGAVYYLGDTSSRQIEWVNAFAEAITGNPVRTAPKWVLYSMALAGEIACKIGIPAPLHLSRYYSLITTNPAPTEETVKIFGRGPYSFQQGVQETVSWLKAEGII